MHDTLFITFITSYVCLCLFSKKNTFYRSGRQFVSLSRGIKNRQTYGSRGLPLPLLTNTPLQIHIFVTMGKCFKMCFFFLLWHLIHFFFPRSIFNGLNLNLRKPLSKWFYLLWKVLQDYISWRCENNVWQLLINLRKSKSTTIKLCM
jgi:hypothetical protein